MYHTPSSVSYPLNIDKYLKQPYFNTEISATCSVVNTTSYLPSLAAIELLSKLMITVNISTSFNFYCHFLKTCSFVSYFFGFWHGFVCLCVCTLYFLLLLLFVEVAEKCLGYFFSVWWKLGKCVQGHVAQDTKCSAPLKKSAGLMLKREKGVLNFPIT